LLNIYGLVFHGENSDFLLLLLCGSLCLMLLKTVKVFGYEVNLNLEWHQFDKPGDDL